MDTLSEALHYTDKKATFDTNAKRILANKQVLARILKKTVSEFKELSFPEIMSCIEDEPQISTVLVHPGMTSLSSITGMANEDKIPGEGNVFFDIRFYARVPYRNDTVKIIINVEAQKNFHPGYHLETRGVFYCARLISAQLNTEFKEPDYDELKKVYSIWICFESTREQANAISEYKITKHDILKGIRDNKDAYDKMSIIMITLNPEASSEDQFIDMLNCLFHENDIKTKKEALSSQYGFAISDDFGKELNLMCNLSEALIEKGIEKGIKQGRSEGLMQGRSEGENRLQQLLNCLLKAGRHVELEEILAGNEQLKQQLYKEFKL